MTTILLLEDNGIVRQMLSMILRGKGGYRVLEAGTEGEAAGHIEQHAEEIDLLIADVCVEDRPGRDLADRLARRQPHLRVLFISGYPKEHLIESGWVDRQDAFLAKPFSPERLLRSVKEVLGNTWGPHTPRPEAPRTAYAGGAS